MWFTKSQILKCEGASVCTSHAHTKPDGLERGVQARTAELGTEAGLRKNNGMADANSKRLAVARTFISRAQSDGSQ